MEVKGDVKKVCVFEELLAVELNIVIVDIEESSIQNESWLSSYIHVHGGKMCQMAGLELAANCWK